MVGDIEMSKFLLIGDLHFGEKSNSEKYNKQVLDFIDWVCGVGEENGVDGVVQLGDYFHTRHKIDVSTLNYGLQGAERLSATFSKENVCVIIGNHDLYYLERLDMSSVNSLKHHVTVVSNVSDIAEINPSYKKGEVLLTPWIVDAEMWDDVVNKSAEYPYIMGHFEFQGFVLNEGYAVEHGWTHKSLKRAKRVISGHYHSPQEKDNVLYAGTPYPITMNEANEEHGVYILDTDTGDIEFIRYDGVKVISIPYDQFDEDLVEALDPENTSIRIEFPDDLDDETIIDDFKDVLSSMKFNDVKIKHTSKAVTKILEADVGEVESVENVDEVVMKFLTDAVDIDGVDKEILTKYYLEAKKRGEEEND